MTLSEQFFPYFSTLGLLSASLMGCPASNAQQQMKPLETLVNSTEEQNNENESGPIIRVGKIEFGEIEIITSYINEHHSLQELVDSYFVENKIPKNKINDLQRTILIEKGARQMSIYVDHPLATVSASIQDEHRYGTLLKQYGVSLGLRPVGDKIQRGDYKTPEGEFFIPHKIPNSKFFKALYLSYPITKHAQYGLDHGLITEKQYQQIQDAEKNCKLPSQSTRLGNAIEIHGHGGGPGYADWTHGCIALTNQAIEEVYNFTKTGCRKGVPQTRVVITP